MIHAFRRAKTIPAKEYVGVNVLPSYAMASKLHVNVGVYPRDGYLHQNKGDQNEEDV